MKEFTFSQIEKRYLHFDDALSPFPLFDDFIFSYVRFYRYQHFVDVAVPVCCFVVSFYSSRVDCVFRDVFLAVCVVFPIFFFA